MAEKARLDRQAMCDRLAMEFEDGWVVNLGIGIPTLCSNYIDPSRETINQSENGDYRLWPSGSPRRGRPAPGERRRPVCNQPAGYGHCPPRRFFWHYPGRHGRRDRFGGLRSLGERRLCQLAAAEPQRRRDWWGHGPGGLRQAGVHCHGTLQPQGTARPGCSSSASCPLPPPES